MTARKQLSTSTTKSFLAIMRRLRSLRNARAVEGMARFGITTQKAYGISAPVLRKTARGIGKDHTLAQRLWSTRILDARLLASLIEEPSRVTERQMDRWAAAFDNWAICDCCCLYVFHETPFAWKKVFEWNKRSEEFVKRASFALMAVLAVHDKKAPDSKFIRLLPIITREANDERNFVKKAVNWALRQIGKRNLVLNAQAIRTAHKIKKLNSSSARWIANDALRELTSVAVQLRLEKKHSSKIRKET